MKISYARAMSRSLLMEKQEPNTASGKGDMVYRMDANKEDYGKSREPEPIKLGEVLKRASVRGREQRGKNTHVGRMAKNMRRAERTAVDLRPAETVVPDLLARPRHPTYRDRRVWEPMQAKTCRELQ